MCYKHRRVPNRPFEFNEHYRNCLLLPSQYITMIKRFKKSNANRFWRPLRSFAPVFFGPLYGRVGRWPLVYRSMPGTVWQWRRRLSYGPPLKSLFITVIRVRLFPQGDAIDTLTFPAAFARSGRLSRNVRAFSVGTRSERINCKVSFFFSSVFYQTRAAHGRPRFFSAPEDDVKQ